MRHIKTIALPTSISLAAILWFAATMYGMYYLANHNAGSSFIPLFFGLVLLLIASVTIAIPTLTTRLFIKIVTTSILALGIFSLLVIASASIGWLYLPSFIFFILFVTLKWFS